MEATATKATFQKYPAYKDSGVEWLGELPKNWDEVPLCTLTKLKSVNNCSELELLSVYLDLGVIKFSDVEAKRTNVTSQDLSKYQRVDIGDFVLNNQQAWRGSVGVSNHQGIVSPAYLVLELSKKLHTGYANYMFRSGYMVGQYLINSKGVGTIQRNLYWPSLRRAKVILPPLPEQTAVAAFLDDKTAKIDRAIAQKEKMIVLLKERKQIIIQNAVTKGLDPNAKMKDSGVEWIGEIPEGWEVKRLKFLLNELNIRSETGAEELLSLSKYCGVIPKSSLEERAGGAESLIGYKIVKENHLVINKMQAVNGLIAVAKISGITSPDYSVYFVKDESVLNIDYLCQLILQPQYLAEFKRRVTGVMEGFIRLYTDDLYDVTISLPPIQEQTAIVSHIGTQSDKIDKAIKLQEQQIEKLKELKSTLIDSAVTGKIKVS